MIFSHILVFYLRSVLDFRFFSLEFIPKFFCCTKQPDVDWFIAIYFVQFFDGFVFIFCVFLLSFLGSNFGLFASFSIVFLMRPH